MKDHYPTQIVTQSTWQAAHSQYSGGMAYGKTQGAIDSMLEIYRILQTENAELQAKIEGYEKYIKILEGQIKIAENIILNNNK